MTLHFVSSVWLGLILTTVVYVIATVVFRALGRRTWANPVLWSVMTIIGVLYLTDVDYAHYMVGGALFSPFLGAAVSALAAIPFRHRWLLRKSWCLTVVAVGCGSLASLLVTVGLAWGFGANEMIILSAAPKQATSPVALGVASLSGGSGELAAVLAVMTGILGATFGIPLLNFLGITDQRDRGLAMGVSAHAIGTAHISTEDPAAAAFSAIGMVLAAIFVLVFTLVFLGLLELF